MVFFQKNILHWIRPSQVQCDSSLNVIYATDQTVPELIIQSPLPLSKGIRYISSNKRGKVAWFPHGLEKWENFFQSGNFEQTGKVREICPKYWENEGNLPKILEK